MANAKNPSRRRFVVTAGALLACSALPREAAAAKDGVGPGPQPFAIPDYNNNPFLRPIGSPHTSEDPARPTPPAISGTGVS